MTKKNEEHLACDLPVTAIEAIQVTVRELALVSHPGVADAQASSLGMNVTTELTVLWAKLAQTFMDQGAATMVMRSFINFAPEIVLDMPSAKRLAAVH